MPLRGDKGHSQSGGYDITKFGLAPGRHTLTVTIVPDPDLALEESATIDEILGTTISRDVGVVVPRR
jgi:hypothetical protein